MTTALSGIEIAQDIENRFSKSIIEYNEQAIVVKKEKIAEIADYLKNSPALSLDYLGDLTAVDYYDYFEVVYRLISIANNRSLVLKVRCSERDTPSVPSVTNIWKGADLMEREIYDLMGISFTGHPNLRRIVTWEGFSGHPLRKDYL